LYKLGFFSCNFIFGVIINLNHNDVSNDYFFPHTKVIDGYLVEDYETCKNNGFPTIKELSKESLKSEYKEYVEKSKKFSFRNFLQEYSLLSNLFAKFSYPIRAKLLKRKYINTECLRWVDVGILGFKFKNYTASNFSLKNRSTIKLWIDHSENNNYELIFSVIRSKDAKKNLDNKYLIDFLKKNNGKVWNFEEFTADLNFNLSKLYHDNDGHLSDYGNYIYSKYIEKNLSFKD